MNRPCIASFDVDAQKSFTPICPDELPVPEGDMIGEELNYLAGIAQYRVGSKDAHSPMAPWVVQTHDQMLKPTNLEHADLTWVKHCVPGTDGFELLQELPNPLSYDFFVWKGVEPALHPYGACYHDLNDKLSTGVIEYLQGRGVDTVIVGGLALDFCVKTTAIQLARAGFKTIVHLPACRAISQEGAASSLLQMKEIGILITTSRKDLLNQTKTKEL